MLFFLAEPNTSSSLFSDWLSPPPVPPAALGIVLTSGCATSRHCQQQELPGVRIHCCDSDLCNSAPSWHPGTLHYIGALFSLLLLRMWLWYSQPREEHNTSGLWGKHFVLITLISSLSCSYLRLCESFAQYGVTGEHLEIVAFVTLLTWTYSQTNGKITLWICLIKITMNLNWWVIREFIVHTHSLKCSLRYSIWDIMRHLLPWKKDQSHNVIKSFQ